jgi:hypothetical protein
VRFQFGDQIAQAALGIEGKANLIASLSVFCLSVLLAQAVGLLEQVIVEPVGNARLAIKDRGFALTDEERDFHSDFHQNHH